MEQWTACGGQWKCSEFYIQCKNKKKFRHSGARAWLTKSELCKKYGCDKVAEEIIASKEADKEASSSQIRPHPDMGGVDTPESCQKLVLFAFGGKLS